MLSKSSSQTHPVQNHQNYGLAIKAIIQQVETCFNHHIKSISIS